MPDFERDEATIGAYESAKLRYIRAITQDAETKLREAFGKRREAINDEISNLRQLAKTRGCRAVGIAGGIRRYSEASAAEYLMNLQPAHMFMTIAAFVTAAAQLFFFINFFGSLKFGPIAAKNPWDATTLEWITDSPPAHDNFGGNYPSVYRGPYEFSVPGAPRDFIPQDQKPGAVE